MFDQLKIAGLLMLNGALLGMYGAIGTFNVWVSTEASRRMAKSDGGLASTLADLLKGKTNAN